MNYYERHLGDYAKDTGHLSILEYYAYRLLLDLYYSTEAGIPETQAFRLARARTPEEREAVEVVLAEFFELIDGVWINRRAEEEIEKARVRIEAAKENGRKGGRPKKNPKETQEKPTGFSLGSVSETQTEPSEKLTKHQAPDTSKPFDRERSKAEPEVAPESVSAVLAPPTEAGSACLQMRDANIQGVNPSHPKLLALLAAGITPDEIGEVAREPKARGKGMAWVLAAVEGRRRDAASVGAVPSPPPGGGARASPAEQRRQKQDQWLDELLPNHRRRANEPKDLNDERTLDATPRLLG